MFLLCKLWFSMYVLVTTHSEIFFSVPGVTFIFYVEHGPVHDITFLFFYKSYLLFNGIHKCKYI